MKKKEKQVKNDDEKKSLNKTKNDQKAGLKIVILCVFLLVFWDLILTAYKIVSLNFTVNSIIQNIIQVFGVIIQICIFAYLGFYMVNIRNSTGKKTALSGALVGFVAGLFIALIGIIAFYTTPELFENLINQTISEEINEVTATKMFKTVLFSSLIITSLANAIIGMIISWTSGFTTAVFMGKERKKPINKNKQQKERRKKLSKKKQKKK